ncbi:unnamed protein product [Lupinus luteus]|uniref:Uncharacterized protein n=1 Tax=Lupinus luteus TaxID=3873 RepID=A0AAV1X6B7_LUPLU
MEKIRDKVDDDGFHALAPNQREKVDDDGFHDLAPNQRYAFRVKLDIFAAREMIDPQI